MISVGVKCRVLLIIILGGLAACGYQTDPFAKLDLGKAPASTQIVHNNGISLRLAFMDKVRLSDGSALDWNQTTMQPYIVAANQWLSALVAVEGVPLHELTFKIWVQPFDLGNGVAGPDTEVNIGGFAIPTSGSLMVGSHTYEPGFDQVEFYANILHEMGHIWGIGSFTEDHTHYYDSVAGLGFRVKGGVAVDTYNKLYAKGKPIYHAVPFSDDAGHLYDYIYQEDNQRQLENGVLVPPMTQEVMANGVVFGPMTLAVLDDIGYVVNHEVAEKYVPRLQF